MRDALRSVTVDDCIRIHARLEMLVEGTKNTQPESRQQAIAEHNQHS